MTDLLLWGALPCTFAFAALFDEQFALDRLQLARLVLARVFAAGIVGDFVGGRCLDNVGPFALGRCLDNVGPFALGRRIGGGLSGDGGAAPIQNTWFSVPRW